MVNWTFCWPRGVSTNHLYAGMGRSRRLSDAYQAWRDGVIVQVRQSGQRLPDGPLAFSLELWPPKDKRRHDASNLLKAAEDAIFLAFDEDDVRIVLALALRHDPSDDPRLTVWIEPYPPGARLKVVKDG